MAQGLGARSQGAHSVEGVPPKPETWRRQRAGYREKAQYRMHSLPDCPAHASPAPAGPPHPGRARANPGLCSNSGRQRSDSVAAAGGPASCRRARYHSAPGLAHRERAPSRAPGCRRAELGRRPWPSW